MLSTYSEEKIQRHNRAQDIACSTVDFILQYISEAYGDEPIEVQQRAVFMAAHMLAPLGRDRMYS